jgi:hypothetical protein
VTPFLLALCTVLLLALGVGLDGPPLWRRRLSGELVTSVALALAAIYILLAWANGWPWPNWTAITSQLFVKMGRSLLRPPQ